MKKQLSKEVIVEPYNLTWVKQFEALSIQVKDILQEELLIIHHVGSTSIPGLDAKPIIDVIPVVKDITSVNSFKEELKKLGFEGKGEYGMLGRRYFTRRNSPFFCNMHIYEENAAEIDRMLLFKKFLINHPGSKEEYASLKRMLAIKYPNDIYNYCLKKTEFVEKIDAQSGYHGFRMMQVLSDEEQQVYYQILQSEIYDLLGMKVPKVFFDIHAKDKCHIVLRKDVGIIGVAEIEFISATSSVLRSFAIKKEYQNEGNGGVFLKMLEKWVMQKGRSRMLLYANDNTLSFYQNLGYEKIYFDDHCKEASKQIGTISLGHTLD